jgi:hypothetical protein
VWKSIQAMRAARPAVRPQRLAQVRLLQVGAVPPKNMPSETRTGRC